MFFLTFTIPSSACCEQNSAFLLPANPKDARLEQPSREHVFVLKSAIPSFACCEQTSGLLLPANPYDALLKQPS